MARPPFPLTVRNCFWSGVRSGLSVEEAAVKAGVSVKTGYRWFKQCGGVNPTPTKAAPAGRYLSFEEREEIMALHAARHGVRSIARSVGRDPSTIGRELKRGSNFHGAYRASLGQAAADASRRAARGTKLATNLRLRREVSRRLEGNDSPEQIAGRLRVDFPDDEEMRVSHETIYRALYVQGRGGLRRELTQHLRTGRGVRKPRRRDGERRGRIPGMVNISERPPEVEDRAVPGHWEGDLIMGSTASNSAVGTLVERTTGFVMLLHLPDGHTAPAVADALIGRIAELPDQLRRTLTWDQGKEMSSHARIAKAADLEIYFCDPHSPWQRGTNENTNGLLRQYLPKGTDLSFYGPGLLDKIASELNSRPRKRHGYLTPAEVLDQLLSGTETDRVA
jgi:transposase, IS30 family